MTITGKTLIVDPDIDVVKAFERVFADKGLAVATASSGEEALWKLSRETFQGVFTELELRGLSGLDLAEEIRVHRPGLPIFIITASDPSAAKAHTAAAGVTGFLRKPLSSDAIAAAADQVSRAARSSARPKTEAMAAASPAKALIARLRNIVLFLLAPIVGLIYIITFPAVGVSALIWYAVTATKTKSDTATAAGVPEQRRPGILLTIVKIAGIAVVGIAFGLVGPIFGIGILIWFFFEAWGQLGAKVIKPSET